MTEKHYAVAIDGPSGAGKSTLARAAAPLRPADDAIMIDNTDMDFAASLELLLDVIRGSVEQ